MTDNNSHTVSSSNFPPSGWVETTLGEVCEIKHGFAFKGEFITDQENENILLTPGNFEGGGGWKYGKKFYNGEIPENYILKKHDLVVTMTDLSKAGDTLGYPALIPDNPNKKFLHNQRVGLVITKENIDKFFLHYLMKWRDYQKFIVNSATGSTVRHTSPTKISEFNFLLPPLPEQQAIASVLSAFDDKIELLREQNKTLEEMGQVIFGEMIAPQPPEGGAEKSPLGDLGALPEGWRVGKLGEVGQIVCGKTPSKENQEYFGGEIPFIKIPDMHGEVLIVKTEDSLTELGASTQKNKFIPKNSICVSCIATVGLVSITSKDSQTNQQINSIIPNDEKYLEYLYFVLTNMKSNLLAIGSGGSATLNINTSTFSNIEIIIPKKEILEEFHNTTNPIFTKILDNLHQIQSLARSRDELLPRLMSGEVRCVEPVETRVSF